MLVGGKAILAQIASATRSLELVSPFVHGAAIEDALLRSPAKRKRLITRYRPFDILTGSANLGALSRLRRSVEIRFLEDVQARLCIADAGWAYVGSSLLTQKGLDESGADLGLEVRDDATLRALYAQFAQLWSRAAELTPAQWTLALHAADHAREAVDHSQRDLRRAEAALTRFVNVPHLRSSQPPAPFAPTRQTPEFVRRRMEAWAGTPEAARAIAELLAWTIERIPNAAESEAWTVLLGDRHVRLKLGLPELITLEDHEGGPVLSVVGLGDHLPAADRELLHSAAAQIAPSPWSSATGLSREAVRIGLPLRQAPRVLHALRPGLEAYVGLHWSQAPVVSQRAFAPSVLEYLEDELDRVLPWPKHHSRTPAAR